MKTKNVPPQLDFCDMLLVAFIVTRFNNLERNVRIGIARRLQVDSTEASVNVFGATLYRWLISSPKEIVRFVNNKTRAGIVSYSIRPEHAPAKQRLLGRYFFEHVAYEDGFVALPNAFFKIKPLRARARIGGEIVD